MVIIKRKIIIYNFFFKYPGLKSVHIFFCLSRRHVTKQSKIFKIKIKILEFVCFISTFFLIIIFFKCNEKYYLQLFGLAGVPLAPVLANIVLDDLVSTSLKQIPKKVKIIKKYVDDFFIIAHKDIVNKMLEIFNAYHPRIKFTVETEKDSTLNFLDMKIIRKDDNKLKFDYYKKEIIKIVKLYLIPSRRAKVECSRWVHQLTISDPEFHDRNTEVIKDVLKKNNYPAQLIKKHLGKHKYKEVQRQEKQSNNQHTHNLRSQTNVRTNNRNNEKTPGTTRYTGVRYIGSLSENIT